MEDYVDIDEALRSSRFEGGGSSYHGHGPEWSQPDLSLLGNGRRSAPAFPLSLLGSHWADWVERRAQGASSPVDYVASALLASTGAVLANVRRPLAGASWSEPPLVWVGLVGSPSAGKSPAMDAAFGLIQRIEDRMSADFRQELSVYEMQRETAEVRREAWKAELKAAVKADGIPPSMPDGAVIPDTPVRPRVRVADATVEKLGALAAALPRGLLMVRDELAGWLGAFDKYGGGGSDRAFAIEMYGGRSYTVDRMKNNEPMHIRHLSIGVVGGIQPDKLSGVLDGPDDGLAARFLWAWPDALPRFNLARETANDGAAQDAFERIANLVMGTDAYGNPEPVTIRLSGAAENALETFGQEMAVRGHEASGAFAGALGKARGHALRIATILEFLWWCGEGGSEPAEISEQATITACRLLDRYFIPMAERVYGDAAIPSQERSAMALARHLKREGLQVFNARQLRRDIGGALREAAAMDGACAALCEAGLIREKFSRSGVVPGRSARNYEVNPAIFGGLS